MSNLQTYIKNTYSKNLADCSNEELYLALLNYTKLASAQKPVNTGKKKLYYISAEFLIGKLLSNNLINLGLYDDVKQELADAGKKLSWNRLWVTEAWAVWLPASWTLLRHLVSMVMV